MPAFVTAGGRYRDVNDITLAASAARTATGNGTGVDPEVCSGGLAKLDVTAASGTSPTLNAKVQALAADGTTWVDVATFTQATGVTSQYLAVPITGRQVRATWTIGGTTPSFTFSLTVEAYRD